jgi:membrane protein insertase Oxa1/YidC/SpoIIIJ
VSTLFLSECYVAKWLINKIFREQMEEAQKRKDIQDLQVTGQEMRKVYEKAGVKFKWMALGMLQVSPSAPALLASFLVVLARLTSHHAYHNSLSLTLHSRQVPLNIGIFIGIQKMCTLPVVQMTEGGLLWFVDLTTRDPYFVLPVLCGVVANRALVVSTVVSLILTIFRFSLHFFSGARFTLSDACARLLSAFSFHLIAFLFLILFYLSRCR